MESSWRERLQRYLVEAIEAGELVESAPAGQLVDLLLSVAFGQQVEAVLKPSLHVLAAKSAMLVEACLGPWRAA